MPLETKKGRKPSTIWAACLVGILVAILVCLVCFHVWVNDVYEKGEELIATDDYQGAQAQLSKIEDRNYKDTAALLLLCKAHIYYDAGKITNAHSALDSASFSYQTEESMKTIEAFTDQVNRAYTEYRDQFDRELEAIERKYAATPKPSPSPSPTPRPTRRPSTSARKSGTDDPFDVNDYSHPDDFYYDHRDDFYDFEDAEDYFYEHNN